VAGCRAGLPLAKTSEAPDWRVGNYGPSFVVYLKKEYTLKRLHLSRRQRGIEVSEIKDFYKAHVSFFITERTNV
jgi:hypothetical protein